MSLFGCNVSLVYSFCHLDGALVHLVNASVNLVDASESLLEASECPPGSAESVAFVSERKDSLSDLTALASKAAFQGGKV